MNSRASRVEKLDGRKARENRKTICYLNDMEHGEVFY